jgi:diketogulonate reductase-like aldo/keto reductase
MTITRTFGATGVPVPVFLANGGDDRKAAIEALRAGIDLGLRHIDTAELYGSGRVEELVAEAIGTRRAELFLVSKVMPSHFSVQRLC